MTMLRSQLLAAAFTATLALSSAYTPSSSPQQRSFVAKKTTNNNHHHKLVANTLAAAALSLVLSTAEPAAASTNNAAQIQLNAIPPTSIQINVKDLPLIGDVISGTYTKVADGSVANPSISIRSPKDKLSAIQAAATKGHLEFDVSGVLGTHLDVDVASDQAGVARVRIASPLIPPLPFQNDALGSSSGVKLRGKESEWNIVTNLGNGKSYYYNSKTDVTQYEKPVLK